VILSSPDDTHQAGRALAAVLKAGDVVALSGPLGAGKSSFARGVIEALGFAGEVPSPSFGLVIPYAPPDVRLPVWHVDLYRIDTPEEAEPLALDEALYDGALLIEWPERLGDRLWREALYLTLEFDANGGRLLTVRVPPSWEARCPFR
jgi:tRNA threonylcarbamoyladenosine biosynthesis protein TsaE